MHARTWLRGVALALLAPAFTVVSSTAPAQADDASDLTARFRAYGNTNYTDAKWTGGDGTQALKLGDGSGRVLWFFDDTFWGSTSVGEIRRPFQASMARNTMVIQDSSGALVRSLAGGLNIGLVQTGKELQKTGTEWYWGAGNVQEGTGPVQKFYQRFVKTGDGPWDWRPAGVDLHQMPLSQLAGNAQFTKQSVPANVANCESTTRCTMWGTELLNEGTFTYIYGTEVISGRDAEVAQRGNKYLKLARVPRGNFAPAGWRYWNGQDWVASHTAATRMMNGVSEGFSVVKAGTRFALVTQGLEGTLGGDIYSYTASTPWGFNGTQRSRLYVTPETTTDHGIWTYEPQIVKHLSSGNNLVVSYNVNSLYKDKACAQQAYWDASIYRPRFVSLTLPAVATGGGDVLPTKAPPGGPWSLTGAAHCAEDSTTAVPTPSNVVATATAGARITTRWSNPNVSAWNYDMQYRDVTAGQGWEAASWDPDNGPDPRTRTGFQFAPSATSWALGIYPAFHPGHVYEFRVRAGSWAGRTSAWVTTRATAYLATPSGVSVSKPNSTTCKVTWSDSQPSVMWKVRRRNVATGVVTDFGPYSTRTATISKSANASVNLRVQAVNSLGGGSWSTAKACNS